MKKIPFPRIALVLSPLLLVLSDLRAQSSWVGQIPSDPQRFSSWDDGTNWSSGTVPNGPTAMAQVDQAVYTIGGLLQRDNLRILNTTVTLDKLQYGIYVPNYYYYPYLITPGIAIGGTGAGDYGILDFVGAGITSTNGSTYFYPNPSIILQNGRLTFSHNARAAMSVTLNASTGTNAIWFRDNSSASNLSVTLNATSRLDFTDQASLLGSSVNFQGGHIAFSGQSTFQGSSVSIYGPGFLSFSDQATLRYPTFYFNRPAPAVDSIIRFSGNVQVLGGQASTNGNSGVLEITDQANTTAFNVNYLRTLDITGATTGTGTTGRQRATVNIPAATSVIADDARTVSLGIVAVDDLLLGSNSVSLFGGSLRYISDVGGAYLSASGGNLTGGGIIQHGSSNLFLYSTNAVSPYAVPLTVNSGYAHAYREKLGAVTVNPGGSLVLYAGAANSILNHGTVHVLYQSNRTYQVTGSFTQSAGGKIIWGVIPHSGIAGPPLEVAGQAALDGTLTVFDSGYFVGSQRYPLLRAGSITGRFATAPSRNLSPMLSVGVEYTGTEVSFAYIQRPFVHAGATPSQQALGAHLDATLPGAAGDYFSLLLRLNTLQDPALVAAGLGQLAPDRYAVLNEQGFSTAAGHQAALDRQMARLRRDPSADGFAAWVEGGQQQNRFSGLDGLPPVRCRTDRGLAGVTWRRNRWSGGLTLAQDRSTADLDGIGSRARISAQAPGGFVQYDAPRFFVNASASFGRADYNLFRNSGLIGRPSVVSAAPTGRRTDLSATIGSSLQSKAWTLTPYAGVLASHVRLDDFTESRVGGAAGTELAFSRWSVGSLRTRAGLDLSCATLNGRLVPRLSVIWLHELEDERGFSAGLAATGAGRYRAPGRPAETDLVQASFGVDWRLTRQLGCSLNAGLAAGRNSATSADLSVGFRWEF